MSTLMRPLTGLKKVSVIGSWEIRMQFTKIGTVITVFAEYVAYTFHICAK